MKTLGAGHDSVVVLRPQVELVPLQVFDAGVGALDVQDEPWSSDGATEIGSDDQLAIDEALHAVVVQPALESVPAIVSVRNRTR